MNAKKKTKGENGLSIKGCPFAIAIKSLDIPQNGQFR
jgi:hypothetical protein